MGLSLGHWVMTWGYYWVIVHDLLLLIGRQVIDHIEGSCTIVSLEHQFTC